MPLAALFKIVIAYRFYAFHDAKENYYPDTNVAPKYWPNDSTQIINSARNVQNFIAENKICKNGLI